MPNVYLLSIGINTYRHPSISSLHACVSDVQLLRRQLLDLALVRPEHCSELLDARATRQQIIQTFRQHFGQIADGDIALLHFSGHGTRQRIPRAFSEADLEIELGKMEATCCYDSRCGNTYSIADKEWRWLIAELQTERPRSLFVGLFDCCHSGSMTREEQVRIRRTGEAKDARPLVSLLEGQYQAQLDRGEELQLPPINYLSFSACAYSELARENAQGGYFTRALVEALRHHPPSISYADLHRAVQASVIQWSKDQQHPYLDCWGTAHPHHQFLSQQLSPANHWPRLFFNGTDWQVNLGAIHGLTLAVDQKNVLPIVVDDQTTPIGAARVRAIHPEKTQVQPQWESTPPTADTALRIALYAPPLALQLEGQHLDQTILDQLETSLLTPQRSPHFQWQANAQYVLQLRPAHVHLYRLGPEQRQLLIGLEGESPLALDWLLLQIHWIAKWEMLQRLRTPRHGQLRPHDIDLHCYLSSDGSDDLIDISPSHQADFQTFSLPYPEQPLPQPYRKGNKHPYTKSLHCLLVHLDRKYAIQQKIEDYEKPISRNSRSILYDSTKQNPGGGLGIGEQTVRQATDTFLLIASTEALSSASFFEQRGFAQQFGRVIAASDLQRLKEDLTKKTYSRAQREWVVKRFTIQLKRAEP